MRDLLKSKNFKILLFAIVALLVIMIYSASTSGQQNVITALTSFITTPIQRLSALISGGVNDFGDSFTDIDTIRAETELLTQKALERTAHMVDYEDVLQ